MHLAPDVMNGLEMASASRIAQATKMSWGPVEHVSLVLQGDLLANGTGPDRPSAVRERSNIQRQKAETKSLAQSRTWS